MSLPWLRLIDAAFGLAEVARTARGSGPPQERSERPDRSSRLERQDRRDEVAAAPISGAIEARLTGIVVAALKEAFNRDHQRLELEREHLASEQARADRALRLELVRQVGEREIGRLRLLVGVTMASVLGSLFFATRLAAQLPARLVVGGGLLLLLASLASGLSGQATLGRSLDLLNERSDPGAPPSSGAAGAAAMWLLVFGLGLVGIGVLL
jgi:hypothetical protein